MIKKINIRNQKEDTEHSQDSSTSKPTNNEKKLNNNNIEYELANELENSLISLKNVIDESERILAGYKSQSENK